MEAAIAVALVNGTDNVVCLLQDSVLMVVAVCYTKTWKDSYQLASVRNGLA